MAFTAGCAHQIFKLFTKTKKKLPKTPVGWTFTMVSCRRRPACLWASLHAGRLSVLAGNSGCCATEEENGYYGWKVARPCCHFICRFNNSQNNLAKISSSERDTQISNCYCRTSQVATELNGSTSHLNVSTSHPLYFATGKNLMVSNRSFLKVKEVQTSAMEALPQATFGLWAQRSQWNIFLAVVQRKKADF